jgi:hypothetical protein
MTRLPRRSMPDEILTICEGPNFLRSMRRPTAGVPQPDLRAIVAATHQIETTKVNCGQ